MLAKIRALCAQHFQAFKNSFKVLAKKPFSSLMTIIVIAITLTLPTLFWVFADNLEQLTASWQHGGRISLYLKQNVSSADEAATLSRIRSIEGIAEATLKSPAEGLAELQQQEGMQDIMHYLPENPLPAVIEVVPSLEMNTSEKLNSLCTLLRQDSQVEQVKLDVQWINRLQTLLHLINNFVHGLMILLALSVVLIIGNTLRLAIHNRQNEIQVLKLIGAADAYIMRPFLYSGIWYGLTGAILAVVLVEIFISQLTKGVDSLATAYQMHYDLLGLSLSQIMLLLFIAMGLGWLSAHLSVKRHLATIEPCA